MRPSHFGFLLVTALALCAPLAAQQTVVPLSNANRQRGLAMLKQFREDIEKHYYDPKFRGVDIAAAFKAAEDLVQKAPSLNEMYAAITNAAAALDDSHTYFIPPGRGVDVEYGWRMAAIGDTAYVVKVDPQSDAQAKGLERGDRVLALNRFEPGRQNLRQILLLYRVVRPQQMQRVVVRKPDGTERTLEIASKVSRRNLQLVDVLNEMDSEDAAVKQEVRKVGEDLVVWRMPTFGDPDDVEDAARKARAAKAVVLDLRGNGGGLVTTLLKTAGWFFDREITTGRLKERKKDQTEIAKPQRNPIMGKLVVLVDSQSASAAEILARVIQIEKRGTIVGDRTAGAVMTGIFQVHGVGVDLHQAIYATSVTQSDVLMSDGVSLEKVGVKPDELVLPTGADLAARRDPVLARAVAIAGGSLSAEDAGKLFPDRAK